MFVRVQSDRGFAKGCFRDHSGLSELVTWFIYQVQRPRARADVWIKAPHPGTLKKEILKYMCAQE